jgi:hypothetical protein
MRSVEASEYLPTAQGGHVASNGFSCCPSKQLKHSVRAQFEISFTSLHVRQLVWPERGWYSRRGRSRALHSKHTVAATAGP